MERESSSAMPRLRADAVRNRERLLAAAASVFAEKGGEASLEAVARAAGVGIGTLYRHFPTREALFEAVYRREVDQLFDLAERLKTAAEPLEALRTWIRASVEFTATKKGMAAALAIALGDATDLTSYSSARLTAAMKTLVDRAAESGQIRADVPAEDLLRALVAMCSHNHGQPGWKERVVRLMDVFIDGLRHH